MAAMSYEAARNERLEENKRRMEELGLVELAKELKKPKNPRKPAVKRKVELPQEARRSSRVAAKPVVIYREQSQKLPGVAKNSQEARERRERQGLRRRYLTEAARKVAVEAAEEVFKGMKNPAFVKPMQHARMSTVFWIALPEEFCKEHMPGTDEKFVLEDEKDKEWECMYIATKTGMSSGWRGFVIDHDLMDGDCCIFELIKPLRFKLHIVRFVDEEEEEEEDSEDSEDEDEDESDEGDRRKSRSKKSRRSFSAKKRSDVADDEEDESDEDEEEEEEDEEEEEFDSDVCDDHVSDEEPEEEEEDSEDDYSPRLSEKEVDTLVAAPSRASRGLKRKIGNEDDDDVELGHGETSNESQQAEVEDDEDAKQSTVVASTN